MNIPTPAQFLDRIDAFLARHGIAETRLGRDFCNEPGLVSSIRGGRMPSLDKANRLAAFMDEQDAVANRSAAEASPGNSTDLTAPTLADVADAARRVA